ncbi:MAG: endolytic transglycosylase MltG [Holosporales bacterium]|nr:endolytic transglycosylase MltG [Holosporales bacterium]
MFLRNFHRHFSVFLFFLLTLYTTRALFPLSNFNEAGLLVYRPVRLSAVAKTLYETRIAPDPLFARIAVVAIRWLRAEDIEPGEYKIASSGSLLSRISSLSKQKPKKLHVMFPTGFTNSQIVSRLTNALALTGHITRIPMEGMLFPYTYFYVPGDSRQSVIDEMQRRREKELKKLSKYKKFDVKQILTLASMIEKETGRKEERHIVASVYFNRLKKNIRLQSCPTVIYSVVYGQKRTFSEISKVRLFNISAYNTYRLKGLPPTPICNPSIESIKAALYPAETDFLFFVADKPDSSSKHNFSKDFCSHVRNKKQLNK